MNPLGRYHAGMSYGLTWHREQGFLHFRITGENSPENVRSYMAEARTIAVQQGCPRVLIEENLSGEGLGLLDIYTLVARGAAEGLSGVSWMAFVDSNPQHDPARMSFAENVAVNRGLNVRVFRDVESARAWLAERASSPDSGNGLRRPLESPES